MTRQADVQPTSRYIVFRIDGIEYVLPMTAIREVLLPNILEAATPTPGGPAQYRVKARGSDTAVVYFGRPKRLGPRNRVLLLNEVNAGLLVDSVSRVEDIPADRQANGKVRLGAKWRSVFDALRLIKWAMENSLTG